MELRPPPPDDAYGRVTNPERFQPVVDAALAIIDELTVRYRVARSTDLAGNYFPEWEGQPRLAVRFIPQWGAPLVWAITPFPGVYLGYGNWGRESFPPCGCDACDEPPDALIERLHEKVDAVVEGRLVEELTRRIRYERIESASGSWTSSEIRLSYGEWRTYGELAERRWPAWPLR